MLGYLIPLVVIVALFAFGIRNKRRVADQQRSQEENLTFGTEVMTTSGLYGTIVGRNEDGSVQLAIAPGVVVKWAAAALRDVKSLPTQYRQGQPERDAHPESEQNLNDPGREDEPRNDPGH